MLQVTVCVQKRVGSQYPPWERLSTGDCSLRNGEHVLVVGYSCWSSRFPRSVSAGPAIKAQLVTPFRALFRTAS